MLSEEEKKEMLEDGKSESRRNNFRFAREKFKDNISFEEYLLFLNNIQQLIPQLEGSSRATITRLNKL